MSTAFKPVIAPKNIVVGSFEEVANVNPNTYLIPLNLANVTDTIEITVTIVNNVFDIYFNINTIDGSLYMSAYTLNKSQYYFGSLKCVFGNYINAQDNGCPYKFYFVDQSNGQNYAKNSLPIDYQALSNGVVLYAELR